MTYTALDEKQDHYIGTIRSSGELLLNLINDILDFSKIEAGELELESKPVELDILLSEVMQLLGARTTDNNVELIVRWPYDEPLPVVESDAFRLRQILINIIGNAIKFTRDGYVMVSIEAERLGSGVKLHFEVKDTGIGIPNDKLDTIFGQFTQVDSSTTREFGGTGLGLAICKRLVSMMGGDIGVTSTVGKGSTFWFDIEVPVSSAVATVHQYSRIGTCLKNKKILIVDDYDMNLELFSAYLHHTGALIDTADDPSKALYMVQEAHEMKASYDVILADYIMPKMDGETLCKKIQHNPKMYGNPKRILITALGKKKSFDSLSQAGISAHLFKPVYPQALQNCIENVLSSGDARKKKGQSRDDTTHKPGSLPQFNARVLVVEDDRVSQRMAKSALNELGCNVDVAGDGKEAFDILSNNHDAYDLVFMDWQMPVMDGHTAIRAIRKEHWGRDLKIIVLTANAINGDREKCLNAGADDYLSKPVRISEVINVFRKYLRHTDEVLPSSDAPPAPKS